MACQPFALVLQNAIYAGVGSAPINETLTAYKFDGYDTSLGLEPELTELVVKDVSLSPLSRQECDGLVTFHSRQSHVRLEFSSVLPSSVLHSFVSRSFLR